MRLSSGTGSLSSRLSRRRSLLSVRPDRRLLLRSFCRGATLSRLSSRLPRARGRWPRLGLLWFGGGLNLLLGQTDSLGFAMLLQDLDTVLQRLDLAVIKFQYKVLRRTNQGVTKGVLLTRLCCRAPHSPKAIVWPVLAVAAAWTLPTLWTRTTRPPHQQDLDTA